MELSGVRSITDSFGDPSSHDLHHLFLWNSGATQLSLSLEITSTTSETPSLDERYDIDSNSYAQITLRDADDYEVQMVGERTDQLVIMEDWFVADCWTTVVKFDTTLIATQSTFDRECLERHTTGARTA